MFSCDSTGLTENSWSVPKKKKRVKEKEKEKKIEKKTEVVSQASMT